MNGRDRWGFYPRKPKKPPPEHGIKVKKTGTTWWGQRWIDALGHLSVGYSNRLARGRSYARAGRTHDLLAKAGLVTAKVTGSRSSPYQVTIHFEKLSERAWEKAIRAMASKAQFAAELLAGVMPQKIDEAFRSVGASLFPEKQSDLVTECSCPDVANPCKHIAATHYVLGEAFDRDPFLLFELRGRTKRQVLESLRAARSADTAARRRRGRRGKPEATLAEDQVRKVSLRAVKPSNYETARDPLPALRLSFDEPVIHGSVLRQLGAPVGWKSGSSPSELLTPLVRAAADKARRLALGEPEETGDPRFRV